MPTYSFRDTNSGECFDKLMRWEQREAFLKENPHLEPIITGAAAIGDPVRLGVRRTDGGFNEVLSKIHSANYKSNLSDKLSRR